MYVYPSGSCCTVWKTTMASVSNEAMFSFFDSEIQHKLFQVLFNSVKYVFCYKNLMNVVCSVSVLPKFVSTYMLFRWLILNRFMRVFLATNNVLTYNTYLYNAFAM